MIHPVCWWHTKAGNLHMSGCCCFSFLFFIIHFLLWLAAVPGWGTADAEMKVPFAQNQQLLHTSLRLVWNGSECTFVCFACCHEFCLSEFSFPGSDPPPPPPPPPPPTPHSPPPPLSFSNWSDACHYSESRRTTWVRFPASAVLSFQEKRCGLWTLSRWNFAPHS